MVYGERTSRKYSNFLKSAVGQGIYIPPLNWHFHFRGTSYTFWSSKFCFIFDYLLIGGLHRLYFKYLTLNWSHCIFFRTDIQQLEICMSFDCVYWHQPIIKSAREKLLCFLMFMLSWTIHVATHLPPTILKRMMALWVYLHDPHSHSAVGKVPRSYGTL